VQNTGRLIHNLNVKATKYNKEMHENAYITLFSDENDAFSITHASICKKSTKHGELTTNLSQDCSSYKLQQIFELE